jgi:membrane associated rhomboid family serine protease
LWQLLLLRLKQLLFESPYTPLEEADVAPNTEEFLCRKLQLSSELVNRFWRLVSASFLDGNWEIS